jgi:uncharacterized protein (DUF697 family)
MEKHESAKTAVKNHMVMAAAAGYIPVPVIDYLAASAIQLKMVKKLAEIHEDSTHKDKLAERVVTTVLAGYFGANWGIKAISLFKVVPFVGSFVSGVSLGISHGATTYALGMVIANHYNSGGNLANLDLRAAARNFGAIFTRKKAELTTSPETLSAEPVVAG